VAKEIRIIQFDQNEVLLGAQNFVTGRSRNPNAPPIARVTLIAGNDGVMGELHSAGPGAAGENSGVIQEKDFLSAMLLFCKQKRIRLPMRAVKQLEMNGASLMLSITIPSR